MKNKTELSKLLQEKYSSHITNTKSVIAESCCDDCDKKDETDTDLNENFKSQVKKMSDKDLVKNLKKYRDKDEKKYDAIIDEMDFRGVAESVEDMIDVFLNADTGEEYYIELCEETLQERKIIIRVNSKGQRTRKIKCPPGKVLKSMNGKKVCAQPTGSERLSKKLSIKQANRTKKAKGTGFKKRTNFKRQRALKKRKGMGL